MEIFKLFGSILIKDEDALKKLDTTDKRAAAVGKTLDNTKAKALEFGKKLALGAGAAVGGLTALAGKAVETGSEIVKFAQVTGHSNKAFQEWDFVMKNFGYSMEQANGDIAALGEKAMDAANGAGEGAELFGMLGVEVTDASGKLKSQEQIFQETILALQGMEDVTQRNAIASALLSTTGEELVPVLNMTSEELANMKANANVISDEELAKTQQFKSDWEAVKNKFGGLVVTLGTEFMPILQTVFDWINTNMPTIKSVAETAVGGFTDAIIWLKDNANWLIPVLAGVLGMIVAQKVIGVISGLYTTFTLITQGVTVAQGLLNLVMMANPFSWVAIVIGVLIAAGIALWMNWDTVKEKAGQLWNWISTTWQNIQDKTNEVFGNVGNTIKDKIEDAKNAVKTAIDKMKGFFNFNWSLPKIKLPHFSVSGSANPINWLSQGVPKINVEWYKDGGIMTNPTMFGFNPLSGKAMVGGEAGPEAILPLSKIPELMKEMGYINNNQGQPIILNIDGREFMRAIVPYKEELDKYDSRSPKFAYR